MRLDEECGVRLRAHLACVQPPVRSERQFDSAPSTCSVEGGRIEWRRCPTGSNQMVQDLYDLHGILDHCGSRDCLRQSSNRAPQRGQTSGSTS